VGADGSDSVDGSADGLGGQGDLGVVVAFGGGIYVRAVQMVQVVQMVRAVQMVWTGKVIQCRLFGRER
jgi:hypothetical protein